MSTVIDNFTRHKSDRSFTDQPIDDALLERIQHFLVHHYQISHVTIQMEYRPCSGPECNLNTLPSSHAHHHHH